MAEPLSLQMNSHFQYLKAAMGGSPAPRTPFLLPRSTEFFFHGTNPFKQTPFTSPCLHLQIHSFHMFLLHFSSLAVELIKAACSSRDTYCLEIPPPNSSASLRFQDVGRIQPESLPERPRMALTQFPVGFLFLFEPT